MVPPGMGLAGVEACAGTVLHPGTAGSPRPSAFSGAKWYNARRLVGFRSTIISSYAMALAKGIFSLLILLLLGLQPTPVFSSNLTSTQSVENPWGAVLQVVAQTRPRITDLRRRLQATPQRVDLHLELGLELETIGDLSGAIVAYRDGLELEPEDALCFYHLWQAKRAQRQLAAVHGGDQTLDEGREEDRTLSGAEKQSIEVKQLRQTLKDDPRDPESHLILGRALFNMGEVRGALDEYRAAVRLHPDHAPAHLGLGRTLMASQDWDVAQSALEEAIRLQPGLLEAHYNLGTVRYTLGDLPGAIAAFRRVIGLAPDFVDAYYRLGLLLGLSGQVEEAAQAFAIAAQAGVPQAQYSLGLAHLTGRGVERDLSATIHWWFRAAGQELDEARRSLTQLRLAAAAPPLSSDRNAAALVKGFRDYRETIWAEFPGLTKGDEGESVGARWLRAGRLQQAVPILIREASALSGRSQILLETLYEEGIRSRLEPFDRRILRYFQGAAAEGLPRPRLALARIYGLGLGVKPNRERALELLADVRPVASATRLGQHESPGLRIHHVRPYHRSRPRAVP